MRVALVACPLAPGVLLSVLPAWAQPPGWEGGPWGVGFMWGVMGVGMMILMIVFWVVLIVGAVALIRWLFASGSPSQGDLPPAGTAEDILKKRYARGEVEKEEFEAKMRDLRS